MIWCKEMASREYNFVSELADVLKCAICLKVARDPHQHEECGKLFCLECIEKYGRDGPCPHCRTQGSQYFRDNRSEFRHLGSDLRVNWSLRVNQYTANKFCKHLACECPVYVPKRCINDMRLAALAIIILCMQTH